MIVNYLVYNILFNIDFISLHINTNSIGLFQSQEHLGFKGRFDYNIILKYILYVKELKATKMECMQNI